MQLKLKQKSVLGKSVKICKNCFLNAFFTLSKNVGPNMKPYSERVLSEVYENGKQKLPTTINDWENCSWSLCKNPFWEKV